jgi:hypothetical protein
MRFIRHDRIIKEKIGISIHVWWIELVVFLPDEIKDTSSNIFD